MMVAQENEKNGKLCAIPIKSASQMTPETQKRLWHIDTDMLRFKLHFFLFMGGLGSLWPYITIFAKNRIQISASSMASILTTQQFLFIFTRPIIGYIADYFNKLKAIICILTIVQTVFFILLLLIPRIEKEDQQFIHTQSKNTSFLNSYNLLNSSKLFVNCTTNDSFFSETGFNLYNSEDIDFCILSLNYLSKLSNECLDQNLDAKNVSEVEIFNNSKEILVLPFGPKGRSLSILPHSNMSTCKLCCISTEKCQNIECEIPKDKHTAFSTQKKIVSDFETYQFWAYAILTTVAMGCTNSLFTLSDTACCESVEKFGGTFGRQRLFGAIGWGLISPIGGLLNDYTSDFTASWILMAVMSFISLLNILRLDLVKPQFSNNLMKDIGSVLKSLEFLAFKLCILLNGVCTGVLWYYLVWYLTVIGGNKLLCGLVQTVQCFVGEIPCMFFSGWVINRIGHFNVVTLSLLCYCTRFFWYSYLCNPWLVLPAECLSGITYGLLYPTIASYAKSSSKPGTEATTQSVLFTAHEGLGAGIGCVVAGIGFDILGGQRTFFYLSMFAGCCMLLSIILHLIVRGRKGSIDVTPYQNQ